MKILLCLALCWFLMAQAAEQVAPTFYVFAPSTESDVYKQQMRSLRDSRAGLEERGVTIWEVVAHGLGRAMNGHEHWHGAQLYTIAVFPSQFTLLLLDKNGGVRLRLLQSLPAAAIFAYNRYDPLKGRKSERKNNKV